MNLKIKVTTTAAGLVTQMRMAMRSRADRCMLLLSGVLASLCCFGKSERTCQSQHGFSFNPIAPVKKAYSRPLSYCKKYEQNTCCNKTHTDYILRLSAAAASGGFKETCRAFTDTVMCSICHPQVGTAQLSTVCPSLCNKWSVCRWLQLRVTSTDTPRFPAGLMRAERSFIR